MALATSAFPYLTAPPPRVSAPDPYAATLLNGGLRATTATGPTPNPYASVLATPPSGGSVTGATPNPGSSKVAAPTGTFTLPDGTTVDYQSLLQNDPLLQQQLAQIQAASAANQASLNGSEQQALIGYGQVPTSLSNIPGLAGALDQTTKDLASQNTASGLSTYARLQNAYKDSVQGTNSSLAARGLLRSGAFGQDNTQDLLGYNQAQSTAVQQLNQYLSGVYNGYLGQQQALQQQEYGAYNTALQNLIAEIQAGLVGGSQPSGTPAPPSPGGGTINYVPPDPLSSPGGTTPLPIGGGNRRGGTIGGRI